jgi:hypothetical protein
VVLKEPAIMRPSSLLIFSGLVLAVAAAVAVGCSQDTLNSGSQNININYTPSPAGSGRFDSASFVINRIQALPADPAEAALFGTERLTFRFEPYTANLVLETPQNYANISLSAGTYVVTLIEFTPLALVDTDLPPPPYAACIDGIATIDAQSVTPNLPEVFQFKNPPTDLSGLTFTLSPGQTSLALKVNVPGLIAGYEASFTCQYVPCTGCPFSPRPKLTAFSSSTFRAALLANVTIE